jgi:hypothetical protein
MKKQLLKSLIFLLIKAYNIVKIMYEEEPMPTVEEIREDFPILKRKVHGDRKLCYLDSAATSQKPQVVIDAIYILYWL